MTEETPSKHKQENEQYDPEKTGLSLCWEKTKKSPANGRDRDRQG